MISDFSNPDFVKRNIRRYANKPRSSLETSPGARLGIEGVSLLLKNRDIYPRKSSTKDINDNKIRRYFEKEIPKQPASAASSSPLASKVIKYQETYNCASSSVVDGFNKKPSTPKGISGIRRTSIKSKIASDIPKSPPKIDETNDIIFRNLLTCGEYKKITYYTYRKVFPVPVTTLPNDIYYQLREQQDSQQRRDSIKKINRQKLKIILPQREAINGHNRFKNVKEIGRLRKESMEGKTEKSRGGDRSNLTPGKSSIDNSGNSLTDNHQFPSVNDKDKDYSDFIDDKRRICSNIECKTFVGEATRNRKLPKDLQVEKPDLKEDDTTDEYLQDSYNYVFQRHVDNLNTVIAQHMVSSPPDKSKTYVHIHPTENFSNETSSPTEQQPNTPNSKPLPKKKKILTKLDINKTDALEDETDDPKSVTFANEETPDETLPDMNVITEKLEEANIFEELNNNDCGADAKPMIIFNHVSSETKSEQVSFQVVTAQRASRSPSPLLEVPIFPELEKKEMMPPLEKF